ncbi:Plant self-incompatibility S1 [Dillenia turbinata]|uniref:S-protein homolog n=1 Tax=Dillenia turbinata TaxID=194707 RepID=A0AAN8Z9S9_9MAGN
MDSLQVKLTLLLFFLLLLNQFKSLTFMFPKQTHVTILNGMPDILEIHCESEYEDLGVHSLPPGETYHFSFRPNLFGSTIFYCSFQWDNIPKYFDIYHQGIERKACVECLWQARPTGPCMFNYDTHILKEIYIEVWLSWWAGLGQDSIVNPQNGLDWEIQIA